MAAKYNRHVNLRLFPLQSGVVIDQPRNGGAAIVLPPPATDTAEAASATHDAANERTALNAGSPDKVKYTEGRLQNK